MAESDVMKEIEGLTFSAQLNLAAGKKAFSRNLRKHTLFGPLVEIARTPEGRRDIADRVAKMAAQAVDRQYEHPAGVAFSAYLTALAETAEPEMIARAARAVSAVPNSSWAVSIANELLAAGNC